MPNDWKPNAPNVNKNFNQKKSTLPPQGSRPVSKAELDSLERQRDKPSAAPAPPGMPQQSNDNQKLEREKRIAYIKNRLEKDRVKSKFNSRLKTKK